MRQEVSMKSGCIRPKPELIVSCRDRSGRNNALVVTYAANASLNPPMVMIGIVPSHESRRMVKETGVFVIHIPAAGNEELFRYVGSVSGKEEDKFEVGQIAWEEAEQVDAPIITQCPVSIECRVLDSLQPGTHELFIASVEAVHCEQEYLGPDGSICWEKIPPMQA